MTISIQDLRKLVDATGLRYFLDPSQDALLLQVTGIFGSYQMVLLSQLEGRFLQFRSVALLTLPPDHPHKAAVLAGINFLKRHVKFGWNARSGEIVAYADTWVVDATVTQQQFQQALQLYFQIVDMAFARIQECMESGKDPGEFDPSSPGPLADKLRKALEGLASGGGSKPDDKGIDKL